MRFNYVIISFKHVIILCAWTKYYQGCSSNGSFCQFRAFTYELWALQDDEPGYLGLLVDGGDVCTQVHVTEMQQFTELKCHLKGSKVNHSLFIRKHQVREKIIQKPPDKTLFVAGVPPFMNDSALTQLFSKFGEIDAVYIHQTPSPKLPIDEKSLFFRTQPIIIGYKVAYIVFKDSDSLKVALQNEKRLLIPSQKLCSGIDKWINEYNESIPDITALKKDIETFMTNFDNADAADQEREKLAAEVDDDGWVTVSKKGRNPGFSRKESVKNHLEKQSENRRKKKELSNFYRFQIKESKMKNLVALRQKFEEDKKKIATLKATRRFKPF